ncbi:MAG TPA: hypothetical protein VGM37_03960 [Armatimonadota bacterium]|jgi:protein-tyrosine-phosphatase/predicted ATP-grasp superfamily ATP-dependent carboligase
MSAGSRRLNILVTDAQELAGLGAIRSLGRAGRRVTAGYPVGEGAPAAASSRWCAQSVRYPDPWAHQMEFRQWLREQMRSGKYDAILPITEACVAALDAVRAENAAEGPLLLLAPSAALHYTLSKYHSTRNAIAAGIACPESVFLEPACQDDPDWDALNALGFPILFKTDNYLSPGGAYHKGGQYVAGDRASALATLHELARVPTRALAQQMVAGSGAGAFFLRFGGQVHLSFAHRRLHEVPYTGGYSSFRESCHDVELVALGRRVLEAIDYEGVAMVEFRRTADGRLLFLETNGRLWGSLALALHCGLDFPNALLECCLNGAPANLPTDYPDGVRCRNTYPGDLSHLFSILKAHPRPGDPPPPSRAKSALEFAALSVNPTIRHDHLWRSDPMPGFVQLGKAAALVSTKAAGRLAQPLANRRDARLLGRLAREYEARELRPHHFDPPPRRLLFLCYGNICRSPFAELYWNARAQEAARPMPEAISAGFIPEPHRSTPARIALLAAECGVDLSAHRSRVVGRADIDAADAIFVMDLNNWRDLMSRFPGAEGKACFLGAYADGGDADQMEIEDPYELDADGGRACYGLLKRALDGLFARVLASQP